MDDKFKKQLEENGADVDTTLKRFMGNDGIFMKFILKFLDDKNYAGLLENLEQKDYLAAFNSAHTLKGVTANLGLDPIRDVVSEMTELLRNHQEIDDAKVHELDGLKQRLIEKYDIFYKIIEENRP